MQKHPVITRNRLNRFCGDIRRRLYTEKAPVTLAVHSTEHRIRFEEAVRAAYRPARVGEQFGPAWSTHWFQVDIEIPAAWKGREVHLLWDSSSEACVWQDGQPLQGLTGTGGSLRNDFRLTRSAAGGERLRLHIEVACNGLFGVGGGAFSQLGLLRQAEIAVLDRDAWDLLWDFTVIAEMANELPAETPRAGQALAAGNEMVNLCNLDDRQTWPAARAVAAKFYAEHNGAGQHNVSAVGHAHIDTAWLWPLAETRRKCVRTFATAVRYMADYPEYKFACSQAQQLEWMKERYPMLYEKIRDRVKAGQFVPCGGTWVEPDCNLPSGESLVRQFLYGQRFFRREFGQYCREFWNPDVFGYCAQLPQIMRGAGIEFFLTQKLSWNQFNKPAAHTFLWEGLDGSRVLTHFPPTDTYNGNCTVKEALFGVRNFKDHDRARESCLLFGHGDGGGGPTLEMLERLRRMRDVDGLPRIEQRSPAEFFRRCAADVRDPVVLVGELYFELHRGTYTSQANNKRDNRRSEELLHDVEFLAAVTGPYPQAELDRLWKLVLLNQFHDIIPGSSIRQVYQDSAAHYDEILNTAGALRATALQTLLPAGQERVAAVNTLGFPRTEVVDIAGQPAVVAAPALGWAVAEPVRTTTTPVTVTESADRIVLENQFVRAELRRDGRLASLFDKRTGRETLAGLGNQFVLFDDNPVNWEAWDVDVFHLEKRWPVAPAASATVIERHPLRARVAFTYAFLRQTVTLTAISARLDFATEVDWHERQKFLKVEFPVNVRAMTATYEVQFGHLERPTHFNTSHDLARFEVCAHRWADLSEPGLGVALLNDSKYGHAAHGNVLRLSLLRSPKHPDPEADMGRHKFRYALLPHAGDFRAAGVIEEGYRFNQPVLVQPTSAPVGEKSFFQVDRPNVIIETVKKAEDSGALIVRLYEAHGARGPVRLSSPLPVQSVRRCNLLEEEDQPLRWENGGVQFDVTPFQIVTLKLIR